MRSILAMTVLLGVFICMFSVVWPQNSNTVANSNAVRNSNAMMNRLPGKWRGGNSTNRNGANYPGRNANVPCDPNVNSNFGCNPNVNWNEYFNADPAANAVNSMGNESYSNAVMNTASPMNKKPVRKKKRRPTPSLGGAITLGNSMSAMLAAGVL